MAVVISTVSKNSRADRAGILPKEKLLSINGNEIVDVIDFTKPLVMFCLRLKMPVALYEM